MATGVTGERDVSGSSISPARRALDDVQPGATTGIGSLPHRNAHQAAVFALEAYDVPAIPSLPRRSPAEGPIAQALNGVVGVTFGQYGTVAVDPARLDPDADVRPVLDADGFLGLRTFLGEAARRGYAGPVKWQFVGPISVGIALRRAGTAPAVAFAVAARTVRAHVHAIADAVEAALPGVPQIVIVDEPFAPDVMRRDFPIAPDEAIDLLSSAMAAVETRATVGVHCCGDADLVTLLDAGPRIVSLPAARSLVAHAGYLDRFLANGGWVAWGVVATAGPVGVTSTRSWHQLASVWCELVQRGCDPDRLRAQSLLTPECGLGTHSVEVAERVCRTVGDVSRTLRREGADAKFVLGA